MLKPLDLERRFGITKGNIFHGEMAIGQMFFMRPAARWASYKTPVEGLYLCGSGAHPGGGVMGAPGHNAAGVMMSQKTIANVLLRGPNREIGRLVLPVDPGPLVP